MKIPKADKINPARISPWKTFFHRNITLDKFAFERREGRNCRKRNLLLAGKTLGDEFSRKHGKDADRDEHGNAQC